MIVEETISIDKITTDIKNSLVYLEPIFSNILKPYLSKKYPKSIKIINKEQIKEITSFTLDKVIYMIFAWLIAFMSISIIL